VQGLSKSGYNAPSYRSLLGCPMALTLKST